MYVIDEKGIEILDLFEENHEIGAYRRVKVDIVLENKFLRSHEDQDKIDCQCYVFNGTETQIDRLRALPHLTSYESNGDHGLAYAAKSVDLEFGSNIIHNLIGEEFFQERRDFTDDTSDKQAKRDYNNSNHRELAIIDLMSLSISRSISRSISGSIFALNG